MQYDLLGETMRQKQEPTGEGSRDEPGQRVLLAPAGLCRRSGADAPD